MKPYIANIELELYRTVINVVVAKDCKEAVKYPDLIRKRFYKKKRWDWTNMYGAYLHDPKENLHSIILSEDATIQTIAHEAYHCVNGVFREIGIEYCQESEECFAYVIGWLVERLVKAKEDYIDQIHVSK